MAFVYVADQRGWWCERFQYLLCDHLITVNKLPLALVLWRPPILSTILLH
jgi:hypothetical protein